MAINPPAIGTANADAAKIVNAALLELDSKAMTALGTAAVPTWGFMGDSIAGNTGGVQGSEVNFGSDSPMHNALSLYYYGAVNLDNRADGFGFAEGGKTSAYILANQVPRLEAMAAAGQPIPDGLFFALGQNDAIVDAGRADASFANVKACLDRSLAAGVKTIAVMGAIPYNGMSGTDRASALDRFNALQRKYCAVTPGLEFLDVLSLFKDNSGAAEAMSPPEVRWRGALGSSGGTGIDTAHLAALAGRLAGKPLADILRRVLPPMSWPSMQAVDFDATKNPYGNYLGKRGMFLGTGGTINDTTSANIPANWQLTYDASAGITVTPTIVTDTFGQRRVRLEVSGTPTTSGVIGLFTQLSTAAPAGGYMLSGIAEKIGVVGLAGLSLSGPRVNIGSNQNTTNIIPGALTEVWSPRSPRPTYFANDFSGQTFAWSTAYVAGVPISGALEIVGRTAFVRES